MMRHIKTRSLSGWLALAALFFLVNADRTVAGGLPSPLEVRLDMAQFVFVGHVTDITPNDARRETGVRWGIAEISVEEMLKGRQTKTVSCTVVTSVTREYQGAQVKRPTRVGDRAIWLVAPGDLVERSSSGRLEVTEKNQVKSLLTMLKRRKWSKPVNGLKAWAGVLNPEYLIQTLPGQTLDPIIVFAVKNAQHEDIFVPWPFGNGRIDAQATQPRSRVTNIILDRPRYDVNDCIRLKPGGIVYLIPNARRSILFEWNRVLKPGSSQVVLSCSNEDPAGRDKENPRTSDDFVAWTGRLTAPPITVTIPR